MRWAVSVFDNPSVDDSVKVRILTTLADRFGFPVLVRGEMIQDFNIATGELAELTDDELEARIYSYNHDGQEDTPEPQSDTRLDILRDRERIASVHGPRDKRSRSRS